MADSQSNLTYHSRLSSVRLFFLAIVRFEPSYTSSHWNSKGDCFSIFFSINESMNNSQLNHFFLHISYLNNRWFCIPTRHAESNHLFILNISAQRFFHTRSLIGCQSSRIIFWWPLISLVQIGHLILLWGLFSFLGSLCIHWAQHGMM